MMFCFDTSPFVDVFKNKKNSKNIKDVMEMMEKVKDVSTYTYTTPSTEFDGDGCCSIKEAEAHARTVVKMHFENASRVQVPNNASVFTDGWGKWKYERCPKSVHYQVCIDVHYSKKFTGIMFILNFFFPIRFHFLLRRSTKTNLYQFRRRTL